jgi:DNA-binding SARP family transcriptional activator
VQLSVLEPLEFARDGTVVEHGGPKQGALLAALALHRGHVVSTDTLIDLVWGDAPPPSVTGTLQAYVAALRRVLEPDRAPRSAPTVLLTQGSGYLLRLPGEALDAVRAEVAVTQAGALLAPLVQDPTATADPDALAGARTLLEDAAELWRGTPYAELGEAPSVVAERARLEELRATSAELRALVRLARGDAARAAGELGRLTRLHPLRERLWALRVLALTRVGRQAEALAVLREVRRSLADELGLDPGPELRQLEAAVLRQDAVLRGPAARVPEQGQGSPSAVRRPAAEAPTPGRWSGGRTPSPSSPGCSTGPSAGCRRRRSSWARRASASRGCAPSWRRSPATAAPTGASAGAPRTTVHRRCGRGRRCSTGSTARPTSARPVPPPPTGSPPGTRSAAPSCRRLAAGCCSWSSTTSTGPTARRCGCCGTCWTRPPGPASCSS